MNWFRAGLEHVFWLHIEPHKLHRVHTLQFKNMAKNGTSVNSASNTGVGRLQHFKPRPETRRN